MSEIIEKFWNFLVKKLDLGETEIRFFNNVLCCVVLCCVVLCCVVLCCVVLCCVALRCVAHHFASKSQKPDKFRECGLKRKFLQRPLSNRR